MGKEQSFQQMVLRKLDIYKQKDEVGSLPNNIYNNWLKIDQRSKLRLKTIKFVQDNIVQNFMTLDLVTISWTRH